MFSKVSNENEILQKQKDKIIAYSVYTEMCECLDKMTKENDNERNKEIH